MPHSTDWAGWSTRQTYAAMASNQTAATRSSKSVPSNQITHAEVDDIAPAHVDSNGSPYRSTTHRTIRATVGQGARGLIVEPGAILGAVAGSRVVSDNVADVLAVMNKAIEAEQLDRDRIAEILTDSEGAKIEGVTRAIAGYEIILNKKLEERNNLEETGQWGAGRHNRS